MGNSFHYIINYTSVNYLFEFNLSFHSILVLLCSLGSSWDPPGVSPGGCQVDCRKELSADLRKTTQKMIVIKVLNLFLLTF